MESSRRYAFLPDNRVSRTDNVAYPSAGPAFARSDARVVKASGVSADSCGMAEEYKGPERRRQRSAEDRRRSQVDRRKGMDRRRGPGRRRGEVRRAAEEGEISGELFDFIMAIDQYKRINERPFPSWSEIFEIVQYLGYRKVAPRAEHINTASGGEVLEEKTPAAVEP